MNLAAPVARLRFDESSAAFLSQFAGIEVRIVFKDLNGTNVLLGGQARYFDEQPQSVEAPGPYKCLGVTRTLLPIADAVPFLDQLFQNRIELPGQSVQIAASRGSQPTTDLMENRVERNFEDEDEDRFGVSWFTAHPDDLFGKTAMDVLEKELRTSAMFTDLKDLLDSFTPGLDAGRDKPIRFDLRIPVLVKGRLIRHGPKLDLSLRCGGRIDTNKLNLSLRTSKHGLGAARGNKPTRIAPASLTWRREGQLQIGESAIESPPGAPREVLVAYEGYPIAIYETEEGTRPLEELILSSARARLPGIKALRWKNIVHGDKYPFAFLDLDAAGSRKLLDEDASRAKPALEHLQQIFDRVVNEHEGVPFWGGGDGAVGYFVGEGKERLALLAAIKILMLVEAHFLDNHGASKHLRLRAGLHTGVSEWKKDPGKNISGDLSAAGHIQKHDSSAPRLTASADFVAGLPPELRELLLPSGKSEGKEVHLWQGFQPVAAASTPQTGPTTLRVARWTERQLEYAKRQDVIAGKDKMMLSVPLLISNFSGRTLGIAEIRIEGQLHVEGVSRATAGVPAVRGASRTNLRPFATANGTLTPFHIEDGHSERVLTHFIIDEQLWSVPSLDSRGLHRLDAVVEVEETSGKVHRLEASFDDKHVD